MRIGAATTLTALETVCRELVATEAAWRVGVFRQILEMLRWFAGRQVRHVAGMDTFIIVTKIIINIIITRCGTWRPWAATS